MCFQKNGYFLPSKNFPPSTPSLSASAPFRRVFKKHLRGCHAAQCFQFHFACHTKVQVLLSLPRPLFAYEKQQQLSAIDRNTTFARSKCTLTLPSRTHSPARSQPLQLKSGTLCSGEPPVSLQLARSTTSFQRLFFFPGGFVCLLVFLLIYIISVGACK